MKISVYNGSTFIGSIDTGDRVVYEYVGFTARPATTAEAFINTHHQITDEATTLWLVNLILAHVPVDQKPDRIKAVCRITGAGLKEAKEFVEDLS